MLFWSLGITPGRLQKEKGSSSPQVYCFCNFKGTYGEIQQSVNFLENMEDYARVSMEKWSEWCSFVPCSGHVDAADVVSMTCFVLLFTAHVFMLIFAFWKQIYQVELRNKKIKEFRAAQTKFLFWLDSLDKGERSINSRNFTHITSVPA